MRQAQDYLEAVIELDITQIDGVERNPARVRALIRSLSRNISSMAGNTTVMKDMAENDSSLSDKSISSYRNALNRIFFTEDIPAWSPALRSKTAVRTSAKLGFVDPSLAVASLHTGPDGLLKDFNTFGFLFEALCVRDLRVYAQPLGGDIYHYRDQTGLEIDIIIGLHDGRWGAVEVKMGHTEIEKAAANLHKLADKVNADKMKQPSFLMVLTAGQYAIRQDDDILIVPIGCLRE